MKLLVIGSGGAYIAESNALTLSSATVTGVGLDVVFPVLHGGDGEEVIDRDHGGPRAGLVVAAAVGREDPFELADDFVDPVLQQAGKRQEPEGLEKVEYRECDGPSSVFVGRNFDFCRIARLRFRSVDVRGPAGPLQSVKNPVGLRGLAM